MAVIDEIAAERRRQIDSEGWTAEHDDNYEDGTLASAGASYAIQASRHGTHHRKVDPGIAWPPATWPFDREWWKPKGQRRDLIRAAALIVAEIERIDRAAQP